MVFATQLMGVSKALAQPEVILDERTICCAPLYSVVAAVKGAETAMKEKATCHFILLSILTRLPA